jgi:hypothetical protein
VFIQLQCSVDNENNMDAMNVGSSFSHTYVDQENGEEDVFELHEDGEGLIEAPGGRTANYTIVEDRLLCNTWLKIGIDPAVGIDQTRYTYLMRMKEYFDANNTSGNVHTVCSLWSRWSVINVDCQKWPDVKRMLTYFTQVA